MAKDWRQGEDWRDGFAKFFGQDTASIISTRKPGLGMDNPQAGLGDWIWGRDQDELTGAYQDFQGDENKRKYKSPIESLGGTFSPDMSAGQLEKQLRGLQRKDDNKAFTEGPQGQMMTHQMSLQTKQLANQTTQLNNANNIANNNFKLASQTANNQMELTRLQMDQQNKDRGFDRETASADRNLSLQLANMQSDLADKRLQYDRETRSMDKRDRAIAQLMSGLGSLGGAFSL